MITTTTSAVLNGLTPVAVTFSNSGASDKEVKLYAAAIDNRNPAGVGNAQGGEAVAESWLEVSDDDGNTWDPLTFPATFPAKFADLSNCKSITVPAGGSLEVLLRYNVPADAASSGVVNQLMVWRYAP